jgi:hypothetical protein
MSLEKAFMILRTGGFISELSEDAQVKVMEYSLARINTKTDMIALDPKCKENHLEDEGRTLIAVNPWNQKNKETAEELRKAPNCRFTVTFMLAEEY